MRILLLFIQGSLITLFATFMYTQVIGPILRDEPLFPMAREKHHQEELQRLRRKREALRLQREAEKLQQEIDAQEEEASRAQIERYEHIQDRIRAAKAERLGSLGSETPRPDEQDLTTVH